MTAQTASPATLWRITIAPCRAELDAHGAAVLKDIHELGLTGVTRVSSSRLFFVEGELAPDEAERVAAALLTDPVTERHQADPASAGTADDLPKGFDACVEVHLKGGVMDVVAGSTASALEDMGHAAGSLEVATARMYCLAGVRGIEELELIARRLLFNDCIEQVFLTGFGRHDPRPVRLPVAPKRAFEVRLVAIRTLDEAALRKLSREAHLFLSLDEMRAIQRHYRGLQRDPTDLELEMFAQTWSEHCVHKTLKSVVRYLGAPLPAAAAVTQTPTGQGRVEISYENLLRDTVARATRELMTSGRTSWCLSVFVDNAGIIEFDEQYGVAFKVETHNHPSAIEPYGGAATGVGGCIRDVMGCGLGAKPIANTDVFCVGRPEFPMDRLPKGVLHPWRVLKGIVAGVRDYGNRMGIPTVNGAILFDDRYLGNPLVFCGCVGLIPRALIDKQPQPGDLVVVIGGRTGRDGIHGATFSSAELTDTHADEFSHAVQIGNAITEKQVLDAMLQARDHADGCLYTAVTDCGAGGLSSAVGEMGEKLGAEVDLSKVPLKYAGLRYDEIWISEAQERMVLSVPPANWPKLEAICKAEAVEASVIGHFRSDGKLVVNYAGRPVGEIDMAFLHGGIPGGRREATWQPPTNDPRPAPSAAGGDVHAELLTKISTLNEASKEWVFRQYDHEVQGGSVIKPAAGPGDGPSDGAVLRPRLDNHRAITLANGICPQGQSDPYWMAVAAIDEAVRNTVCVGGDPKRTAILDNFCWGNCDDPQVMGTLVRACQGCFDAAVTYGVPFISGKDSLNNEFAVDPADAGQLAGLVPLHNNRIRIPETLLISAMSVIEDAERCTTMDLKAEPGSSLVLVGLRAGDWPQVRLSDAAALHAAVAGLIAAGHVLAAHDVGENGWLGAAAEMAIAGRCGAALEQPAGGPLPLTALPSAYVLQVSQDGSRAVDTFLASLSRALNLPLGRVQDEPVVTLGRMRWSVEELAAAWRAPLAW